MNSQPMRCCAILAVMPRTVRAALAWSAAFGTRATITAALASISPFASICRASGDSRRSLSLPCTCDRDLPMRRAMSATDAPPAASAASPSASASGSRSSRCRFSTSCASTASASVIAWNSTQGTVGIRSRSAASRRRSPATSSIRGRSPSTTRATSGCRIPCSRTESNSRFAAAPS